MSAVGKELSERVPARAAVDTWADTIAAMLTSYLTRLAPR